MRASASTSVWVHDTQMAMTAPARFRIDFVSDVACPWCAIGLASLKSALTKLEGSVEAEIHLQPFELNPQTPLAGEDAGEHIRHKYGIDDVQLDANRKAIRERAAPLGVAINTRAGSRVWNTFDAHRLLHWAGLEGEAKQRALKHALLGAYHTRAENPGARDVLLRLAGEVGLDVERARAVLDSDEFAAEVRERERFWQERGIHSVPAVVIDGKHLISGGQPPEVFEQALRQIAARG